MWVLFNALFAVLSALCISTPKASWPAILIIWAVRIATTSLLLRSYIIPWALARTSKHVRIRSISLRSIRGLYISKGNKTIRIERIGYSLDGNWKLLVEGVKVHVRKREKLPFPRSTHRRSLTLERISQLERGFWNLLWSIYAWFSPIFRPLIKNQSISFLRLLLRWIPRVAQDVTFEISGISIIFPDIQNTTVTSELVSFKTSLSITQHAIPPSFLSQDSVPHIPRVHPPYSIGAWRNRLRASVKRSWNQALERTQGNLGICLRLGGISASTVSSGAPKAIFSLPDSIVFTSSFTFDPRHGRITTHSLKTSLALTRCVVELSSLLALAKQIQAQGITEDSDNHYPDGSSFSFPASSRSQPLSPPMSPSSLFHPSPKLPSHGPPRSPLMKALSRASFLSRRNIYPPCTKLKETRNDAMIAFLRSFEVNIQDVVVNLAKAEDATTDHTFSIRGINFFAGLSDSTLSELHRRTFGRSTNKRRIFDPDVYCIKLGVGRIKLDRYTVHHHLRLLTIESIHLEALLTQFPSPWLVPSPFLGGDPNGPLVVVSLVLGAIQLTDHLSHLTALARRHQPSEKPSFSEPSSGIYVLPRIMATFQCKVISARLLVPGGERNMIEVRSDGFTISADSTYATHTSRLKEISLFEDFDFLPLYMSLEGKMVVEPTFIRIRSRSTHSGLVQLSSLSTTEPSFMEDPVLLSLEQVSIGCRSSMLCDIRDDTLNIPHVNVATLVTTATCTTEAICVELWNQAVAEALAQAMSALPPPKQVSATRSRRPLMDGLPVGLSATFFLGRAVVFVTHPDLNPSDDLDLSRGVAIRAERTVLQYCSMQLRHKSRFRDLSARSEVRSKLYLPEDLVSRAFASARADPIHSTAVVGFRIHDLNIRSALATQFAADDPGMAEADNPALCERQILSARTLEAEVALSVNKEYPDVCDVLARLQVRNTTVTLSLSHAYHLLLAAQRLSHLSSCRPRAPDVPQTIPALPSLTSVTFKLRTETIQVYLGLPRERVVLRFDTVVVQQQPRGVVGLTFHRAKGWIFLRSLEDKRVGKWKEVLCLMKWQISKSMLRSAGGEGISVEGNSARIRIPFGYVVAHLIQDIGVSVKAARHLAIMIKDEKFYDFTSPEAEGPKIVPRVHVAIAQFAFEMEDDPFEQKLAVLLKAGAEAVHHRILREQAFEAKVAAIRDTSPVHPPEDLELPKTFADFSTAHSVSISDARARLDEVHSLDWILRYSTFRRNEVEKEANTMAAFRDTDSMSASHAKVPNIVKVSPNGHYTPLFRIIANNLSITVSPPSFPPQALADFLHTQGGLPSDTEYSLLVPMHLNVALSFLRVVLRDYTIPLIEVPAHTDPSLTALEFDTDFVVAEEMGSELSVHWVICPVSDANDGMSGATSLALSVPKTIMPVKTYANPEIHVTTPAVTTFAWAVSYGPAIQDLMKVLDSLTTAPKDSSPGLGFWDKLRLMFHWSIRFSFRGEVRYYMKGLRDPHDLCGAGAGFLLSWQGHTKLLIGRHNEDREIIQVISDTMMVAIPNFRKNPETQAFYNVPSMPFRKVVAKLESGVRFGLGFASERTCGVECQKCQGSAFHRKCRYFDFRPHYDVRMEKKANTPEPGSPEDSFRGFRSDFIHLSISLTSSVRSSKAAHIHPSAIHLSPRVFSYFWRWWTLFDSLMSLPIRQGTYFPRRINSPKFGRHIATIKYRIALKSINIMHGYMDESRETWVDGVTPWIGVKAYLEDFQVDMHQRDQETIVLGVDDNSNRVIRHKPFHAAEVVMKGLDLRAILAIFSEPLKKLIPVNAPPQASNYRTRNDLPEVPLSSSWYDAADFVELGWEASSSPTLHVLPVVSCAHFMYFKRNSALLDLPFENSKFGTEDTHVCLLGKEPTAPEIQKSMAAQRLDELKEFIVLEEYSDESPVGKKISLVQKYISQLDDPAIASEKDTNTHTYHIPSDTVSPEEWAEFDNVYQVHCPRILLDSAVRDIMIQYYYCSRNTKGLEYRMGNRAVTFLLEQAKTAMASPEPTPNASNKDPSSRSAQAAALALKNILLGGRSSTDQSTAASEETDSSSIVDPLHGWSDGVVLRKSHCCLLLKPQIILHNRERDTETCVVTALQAKLQTFGIMDSSNAEDPVSGKVMSRTFTLLSGMQIFAPSGLSAYDGCVPLEVLIDFRCESDDFDRLVPQTDATFHYDKFNRLRLRNNVTSAVATTKGDHGLGGTHLQDQTDLVRVSIPRFTVTASDQHFKTISNVLTKLLLFTDVAHKARIDKLETMLFSYDFTDLTSAAEVVIDLQTRLKSAMGMANLAVDNIDYGKEAEVLEILKLKAHIYLLSDELNLIFDAIKLAQDRGDESVDRKSALLVNATSSEMSWNMLDERRELLAKLVVRDTDFYWLSRRDSSTVNNLTIGSLQAFDGSKDAIWPEILSKHDEPANHPLLQRGLFLVSDWSILPPVGGITIYENFDLSLQPFRLQIDGKVGQRIMEYLWPARRNREIEDEPNETSSSVTDTSSSLSFPRSSLDSSRPKSHSRQTSYPDSSKLVPPAHNGLRKLSASRSFTSLRDAASVSLSPGPRTLTRTRSSDALGQPRNFSDTDVERQRRQKNRRDHKLESVKDKRGDAAEMRTRSSKKTFVLVRISSLHVLLSMMKEESFVCHEARITTRDLEYRNQTWSFEEIVDLFIPSDTSWKGWVKMAFQQPLVPVLPVAREILKKTKFIPTSKNHSEILYSPFRQKTLVLPSTSDDGSSTIDGRSEFSRDTASPTPQRGWRKASKRPHDVPSKLFDGPYTSEPVSTDSVDTVPVRPTRYRVMSLLSRKSDKSSKSNSSSGSFTGASTSSSVTRRSEDSGK